MKHQGRKGKEGEKEGREEAEKRRKERKKETHVTYAHLSVSHKVTSELTGSLNLVFKQKITAFFYFLSNRIIIMSFICLDLSILCQEDDRPPPEMIWTCSSPTSRIPRSHTLQAILQLIYFQRMRASQTLLLEGLTHLVGRKDKRWVKAFLWQTGLSKTYVQASRMSSTEQPRKAFWNEAKSALCMSVFASVLFWHSLSFLECQ